MKRSRIVQAFLIVSAGSSCGPRHEAVRRCVDQAGNPVDDRNCAASGSSSSGHFSWVYFPAGKANESDAHPGEATWRGVIGAEGEAHAGEGAHAAGGEGGAGE